MDITIITIFVLAIFVGFEIITKVPPTLHTPLMSGSNAISGIAIIGANRAGVFLHLMPIFGALMAMIIFDEKFMFYHFMGAIFIIAGITLSNKNKKNV